MPVWREDMTVFPLVCCVLGVLLACVWGLGPVNRAVAPRLAGWLLSLPLVAAMALLLLSASSVTAEPQVWSVPWIPALGASFALRLDGLSLLFSLLITGIGALVMIYAGYYFTDDRTAWKFLTYLSIFTVAMLGLVQAADLLLLIVFWEGTSIASFLLIGYKRDDPAARAGALKSLLITAGGGVALLIGLALIAHVAGTTDLNRVLESGDLLRDSALYPAMLALVLVGAFTKSAQVPFHVWLPDGMTAPTPASAFLHSATMVKAGVYLLARLNPALGMTEPWFWALSIVGGTTMLLGVVGADEFGEAEGEASLNQGDSLVLITDGLYEAFDARGRQFGLPRVEAALRRDPAPANWTPHLVDLVQEWRGRIAEDDLLAVCVRRASGPSLPRPGDGSV